MRLQAFPYSFIAFLCALIFVSLVFPALSQQPKETETEFDIAFIRVEGSQRVEADTVLSYMALKVGMKPNPELIDKSLKSLFKSGLFADVSIEKVDDGLLVKVRENPIVNQVLFEGNKKLDEGDLTKESTLRPRQVYTRAKIQADVGHYVELYQRAGRFSARIEPKVIQLSQNRVDVIFEIDEGEVTKIRSINFIGNDVFSDSRLRKEISSKESRWYKFFASGDKYDPDRLAYDRELLRRFYLGRGYADFRIISSIADLNRNGKEFFVTFNIEEGDIYSFGPSTIKSSVAEIDIDQLQSLIRHQEDEKYNLKRIDMTVEGLVKFLGEKGYAFADVRPRVRRDRENNTVNIEYRIEEGARVYVERININNNVRTQDKVIRREIRLDEGDAFNRVLLNRSERNIKALNYFSDVEIVEIPGSEPDKTIIDIAVEEQSTGELSLGVGYSSAESFSTQFNIVERNLLGRGQILRFSTSLSTQVQTFNLSLAEPYFLGRDLFGSVDIFRTTTDYDTESSLKTAQTGVGGMVGFPISENGRLNMFVRVLEDELKNSANHQSFRSTLEPYSDFKVLLGYTYAVDKRDDKIEPSEGWRFSMSQHLAGPFGDVNYLRNTATYDYYKTYFDEWIFHARATVGAVLDYSNEPISYNDHFFLGGTIIRGFKRSGLGPRDLRSGYVVGAKQYVAGTLETQIPMGIPKEFGIKGYIFTDFGMLGSTDVVATQVRDDFSLRATYGLSFSWKSPFGPVRFDLARPIVKEDYDSSQFFRFTAGTYF